MNLAGKNITVMGLGRFGGGAGVTRWLVEQGSRVLVTDLESADDLRDAVQKIRPLIEAGSVRLRLGEHDENDFRGADLVIANPAVPHPWDNRYLLAAERAGVPIATEMSLMLSRLPTRRSRIIGITGTVGKSTTTAMIHHALSRVLGPTGERVVLGGNIGGSLLDELPRLTGDTHVVLELSSFMLHWIERTIPGGWSPGVGVVTNIAPNHLDWHGQLDHYVTSKQNLLRHQRPGDTAVLGASVWEWRSITPARHVAVESVVFPGELGVPGAHNRVNASAALAACAAASPAVDPLLFARAIREFPGLRHRLQLAAEVQLEPAGPPVRCYNDSKSTTPEATLTAIEAVAQALGRRSAIHLIAGGYDKGADLSPIAHAASELAGLYTIGATGPRLATAGRAMSATVEDCGTLSVAVERALSRARPGDALLLSPGCASWDQFTNYEARGDEFIALVEDRRSACEAAR